MLMFAGWIASNYAYMRIADWWIGDATSDPIGSSFLVLGGLAALNIGFAIFAFAV